MKPLGRSSQVRAASAVSLGAAGKGTHPPCPGKAGSAAVRVQMGEVEEDSDSSSEESDDDGGVAAAKVSPCLHGPAGPSPFTPGSPV